MSAKSSFSRGMGRQSRQIPGRGVMPLGIQSAGIAVLGVLKAQLCRPLIHQPDKGLLTPGNLHRRRVGCVVARRQQHARCQLMEGHAVPGLQAHGSALHLDSIGIHCKVPVLIGLLQGEQRCHDLGGTGIGKPFIRVLGVEQPSAVRVHDTAASAFTSRSPAMTATVISP